LNGVAVTRIHLEEDTARSQHDPKTGVTLVDFNRAGVPLMELVTEPVIHSAIDAGNFARELQLLLRYLGAGYANMEKGEMRVEANISVGKAGQLGTKVEVKNLNSFRSVERAIEYEVKRQSDLIDSGGTVVQETRGWDEGAQTTFAQRIKEGSADYRYFPDPDLPKLLCSALQGLTEAEIKATLPELPAKRYERYTALGLVADDAGQYVREPKLGDFFDAVIGVGGWSDQVSIRLASNYLATDLVKLYRDNEKTETEVKEIWAIKPEEFAELINMILDKKLSSRGAKDILAIMFKKGGMPSLIAEREGLHQKTSESDLLPVVQKVIAENSTVAEAFKAGKQESLQYLIGQGMKATKGSADPRVLQDMFIKQLA
jgi:aspartyl-tRNA(Asn)/glutamyl-tRNA(Gln) amidotransferase subunit B